MSKLIGPIKSWCDTFHANIFWNSRNWQSVAIEAAPTSPSKASSIYVKLLKLLALIFVFFLLILAFFTLWWRHLSEAVHNGNNPLSEVVVCKPSKRSIGRGFENCVVVVPSGSQNVNNQMFVMNLQKNILQLKSQFCREKVSFWSSKNGWSNMRF